MILDWPNLWVVFIKLSAAQYRIWWTINLYLSNCPVVMCFRNFLEYEQRKDNWNKYKYVINRAGLLGIFGSEWLLQKLFMCINSTNKQICQNVFLVSFKLAHSQVLWHKLICVYVYINILMLASQMTSTKDMFHLLP